MSRVYLAGPIGGLNYGGATYWRDDATQELAWRGITALSPMRGKSYLSGETKLDATKYTQPLSSPKGLTTRDRFDVRTCDLVLANLLGATRVSIGTVIELAWADLLRTPVVLVSEMIGFRVSTLAEAYELTAAILGSPL